MSLNGKCALITGSSRGIGKGIAVELAEQGVNIAVHYYRNEEAAGVTLQQVRKLGSDGFTVQADVLKTDEITAMLDRVKTEFGKLDIFVSNARPEVPAFFQAPMDIRLEQWDSAFDSQAKAFLVAAREAAGLMESGGRIVALTYAQGSTTAPAGNDPIVGGAPMLKTKDIIDNAVNSKDHTTLAAAVKAADLVETLKGAGPCTVFAPTNAAFDKVPKATLDNLMKPESKKALTGILTYHVVAGKHDAASIAKAIEEGKGKASFKTVAGGTLTAAKEGSEIVLTDEKGGKSKVTIADVMQSNGVIHVVDTVLMPK